MWRRYLIGLFVLVFLSSTGALVYLSIDDQHDLSSRAAGVMGTGKRTPLDISNENRDSGSWNGRSYDPSFNFYLEFDSAVWASPGEKDNVFWDKINGISVRLTRPGLLPTRPEEWLGKSFIYQNKKTSLTLGKDWQITEYGFKFLDQVVLVEMGVNPSLGVGMLAVIPRQKDRSKLMELLAGIKSHASPDRVKGVSVGRDESARLVALARPSVVMIVTKYCNGLQTKDEISTTRLFGKEYKFCIWSSGSGFFVSSDGVVATNGHVVMFRDEEVVATAVGIGSLRDLAVDALMEAGKEKVGNYPDELEVRRQVEAIYANKESLTQFAAQIGRLETTGLLRKGTASISYYLQLGKSPLGVSPDGTVSINENILEGKLVGIDYGSYDPAKGFSGSDVALLRVVGGNYPALPLGSVTDLSQGDDLVILGYPSLVSGWDSSILASSALVEPTITKGVVSAIKQAKGDLKNLIQTDASINRGNSGGPALDSRGNVVGIATYGLTPESGGNFNFLRDVADLKVLMAKNGVENKTGSVYSDWKMGLANYWLSYFRYAEEDMKHVLVEYPTHPSVSKYLSDVNQYLGGVEDKTPRYTRSQRGTLMRVSAGAMLGSLFGVVVLVVWDGVAGRRRGSNYVIR